MTSLTLRPLPFQKLRTKINKKIHDISFINGCIIVKFCTGVAHDKLILPTKYNLEIGDKFTDNDVILVEIRMLYFST